MYRSALIFLISLILASPAQAAIPDSVEAEIAALPDSAKVRVLLAHCTRLRYSEPMKAAGYADKAMEVAQAAGTPGLIAQAAIDRGTTAWVRGAFEEALANYRLSRERFAEADDPEGVAKADNNIGLVYFDLSYYDLALDAFMASLKYFEPGAEPYRLATIYNNIGNVCNRTGDLEAAGTYYRKALPLFRQLRDTNAVSMTFNNLGLVMRSLGREEEALGMFESASAGYRATGNAYGLSKVYGNLGSIYTKREQFAVAESLYFQSLEIADTLQNSYEIAVSHLKLAELYLKTDRFSESVREAMQSLDWIGETNALLPAATAHEALAEAYDGLGDHAAALEHYRAYKELNDTIFNKDKAKAISELRIRYETELKDKEIQNLAQQRELDSLRKMGLILLASVIFIAGVLIYFRQRGVIRREKALKAREREVHETQQALAAAELKNAEIETHRLQDELEYKSRELSNLAMNIVQRNDLLEKLDAELRSLRKNLRDQSDEKLKDLSIMVSQTLSVEKERKEFQLFIQEAEQTFFHALEARFPKLTPKEKRLCAMIRLGLSSKEIAAVFNINTSSVEVSRYRLRKKLDLETEQGLREFLDTL